MKFELLDFDNEHYASSLLQTDNILKWDILGNTHHLIIRGDFGAHIEFTEDDKPGIEKHGNDQILSGKEIRYADNRFFSFLPKGYVNNYIFTVSPARYAIFCCSYDAAADVCKLYVPNEACQYQCDVSLNVEAIIKHVEEKDGLFKRIMRKQPDREYFEVYIPNIPGYLDGSLQYTFDGCKFKYPIMKAMLGRPVRIPAFNSRAPRIESTLGNGYKIAIKLQMKGDER
jgi:hypothetical protein